LSRWLSLERLFRQFLALSFFIVFSGEFSKLTFIMFLSFSLLLEIKLHHTFLNLLDVAFLEHLLDLVLSPGLLASIEDHDANIDEEDGS